MKVAAFFFDLDGTLIDSEMLWAKAIVNWLAMRGQRTTVEEFAPLIFGHSWRDIHAKIHETFPGLPKQSAFEDAFELHKFYDELLKDPTQLIISSAVECLKQAAKIAPCAIVSGSPHSDVIQAAKLCGVEADIAFVLGGEDYALGKPAPDGYLKAASILGVPASNCVVIEDSTVGVQAGLAAGMRVVGVNRNRVMQQDFTGVTWLVNDLSEFVLQEVFV